MSIIYPSRRSVLGSLLLSSVASAFASPASGQTAPAVSPIPQPPGPSKTAFLERARALRDMAGATGDQPYGAVIVRNDVIVGQGRSEVVTATDPTAHSEL